MSAPGSHRPEFFEVPDAAEYAAAEKERQIQELQRRLIEVSSAGSMGLDKQDRRALAEWAHEHGARP